MIASSRSAYRESHFDMIICIESWKGDVLLSGKTRLRSVLIQELARVESLYDRETDNFVPLLCRMYGWTAVEGGETPDMTYDRDTGLMLPLE